MSKRTRAFGPAAHNRRKSSRKAIPQYFLGGVAVSGLVLGCDRDTAEKILGNAFAGGFPAAAGRRTERTLTLTHSHNAQNNTSTKSPV